MRVATRRVRAYLKAARPALDRVATDRLRGDVRELAGTLGVIRDNDVMIHRLHTEAGLLGDPDTGALEHLISRLEPGTDRRPRPADQRAGRPVLRGAAGRTRGGRRAAAGRRSLGRPARTGRATSGGRWRRQHRKLHSSSATTRRTTNCTSCGSTANGPGTPPNCSTTRVRSAAFLAALAEFQEVLGDHQDACVLEDRLRELVDESGDPRAGIAAGRVIQGCHERRVAARAAYPAAWKKAEAAGRKAFAG